MLVGITNFLMFFAFYELLPVLPLYIFRVFRSGSAAAGVVISCYTVGALLCRPFAGFIVDSLPRKALYAAAYLVFTLLFVGYGLPVSLVALAAVRLLHGVAFGVASTAGNTIVIDVLPSSRRGEGVGYFGVTTNLAFALGPMTGTLLYDAFGAETVFATSLAVGAAGLLLLLALRVPARPPVRGKRALSFDRFFLTGAVPQFANMILMGCAYGPVVNYVALFAEERGMDGAGGFYALIAGGLIASRLLTGKLVDRGWITKLIAAGMALFAASYFVFSLVDSPVAFFGSALFVGIALGLVFPGYQTMCVNLARHDQRGTATSTYLTGWDLGIGIGILAGGAVAEAWSYAAVFFACAWLIVASTVFFAAKTAPHYWAHRLEG